MQKYDTLGVFANPHGNSKGLDEKMKNPNGRGGGVEIMEFPGHGGITHSGISEGKGAKIWKPSVVWYGYFLESPNSIISETHKG